MPLVGINHGSNGTNGTDLANESCSDNGNEITLEQLLMNLANSGNQKHVQLASGHRQLKIVYNCLLEDILFFANVDILKIYIYLDGK